MAKRDSFLLRTDPKILEALRRWAADELRSVNGQLEFILRRALADAGRTPTKKRPRRGKSSDATPPAADTDQPQ